MSRVARKRGIAALVSVCALAVAGVAVAYFTSGGSGTGSASVGTSSALTIHGTTGGALFPGTSTLVSFTADNPSSGHQQLGTIHWASVKACVGTGSSWDGTTCTNGGTETTSCESVETGTTDTNAANFYMADVAANQDLPAGSGTTVITGGTLKINNLSSSQDACKNANLLLNFTS